MIWGPLEGQASGFNCKLCTVSLLNDPQGPLYSSILAVMQPTHCWAFSKKKKKEKKLDWTDGNNCPVASDAEALQWRWKTEQPQKRRCSVLSYDWQPPNGTAGDVFAGLTGYLMGSDSQTASRWCMTNMINSAIPSCSWGLPEIPPPASRTGRFRAGIFFSVGVNTWNMLQEVLVANSAAAEQQRSSRRV